MKFKNVIEEMKTVRDFKEEAVDNVLLQTVIEAGKQCLGIVEGADFSIILIEDGTTLYKELSGKAGYYGNMIKAPHYIAIRSKKYPFYIENSAYLMEWMRLRAWTLGLGTCWLSMDASEEINSMLDTNEDQVATALIAIGEPYTGIFKKDLSPTSNRLGITELVYLERWDNSINMEYLNSRGMANIFYYAKLAPSWGNKQPCRFIIDNEKVLLAIDNEQLEHMHLDAGIMMLYFEKSAQEEGFSGKWELKIEPEDKEKYRIPEDYTPIGYYCL